MESAEHIIKRVAEDAMAKKGITEYIILADRIGASPKTIRKVLYGEPARLTQAQFVALLAMADRLIYKK